MATAADSDDHEALPFARSSSPHDDSCRRDDKVSHWATRTGARSRYPATPNPSFRGVRHPAHPWAGVRALQRLDGNAIVDRATSSNRLIGQR
jgi:hypothetical protein